jgi:mRNA interferase YafQ
MYFIQTTKDYDKSYVRLLKSGTKDAVFEEIRQVINLLAKKEKLDARYRDHKLQGEYSGYRECHIKSDLLLVYQIHEEQLVLVLIDVGTHSYLFG